MTKIISFAQWQIWVILLIGLVRFSDVSAQSQPDLRIAVASNFAATAKQLFNQFEKQNNATINVSSGSSGALYAQIIHGAPFDMFLSADGIRPALLEDRALIVAGTRKVYAVGQLALWDRNLAPISLPLNAEKVRKLLSNTRRMSIANPTTAPYGASAKQFLEGLDIWSSLAPHLIQGNSVLQAYQFIQTANVTRGLVAYHLVKTHDNTVIIPHALYPPIEQQMVVLASTKNSTLATKLQDFLLSKSIQSQLQTLGYKQLKFLSVES